MKSISKKLKSASGASMLLALLFLFFCLTVGAVVLTAASASAGRTARNRQDQQNYLAVESAAMLLREDLEKASFSGSYLQKDYTETIVNETENPDDPEHPFTSTETKHWTNYTKNDIQISGCLLLERVSSDLDFLYTSTKLDLNQPLPAGFTMRYPLSFEAADMPDVSGSLTVDTSGSTIYAVTAVLWVETDGKKSNFTTLVYRPSVSDASSTLRKDGNPSVKTTTYTTTVTWAAPVITKGGAAS